jgi:Uma2 family endonuclease
MLTESGGPAPFPRRRRFTRAEFERAVEHGLFGPDERLELIGGEVFEKVSPQKGPHATTIRLVEAALRRAYPPSEVVISVQLPLALGDEHEPEPDVSVVSGSIRDFATSHPTTALLVVEVADSTLAFDRLTKDSLYAAAGIPRYWIVNLADRIVEVHADPAPMAGQPFGCHYRALTRHPAGTSVTVPGVGDGALAVVDLLP